MLFNYFKITNIKITEIMPKSKNRSKHAQKINHQRMLDKHKAEKVRKEKEKKYKEFEDMIASHRESIKQRRSEYVKTMAESTNDSNSEILSKALTEGVIVESNNEE